MTIQIGHLMHTDTFLSAVTPSYVPLSGGTLVTVTGSCIASVDITNAIINDVPADIISQTATNTSFGIMVLRAGNGIGLVTVNPVNGIGGMGIVQVESVTNGLCSLSNALFYVSNAISSIQPASGPSEGGFWLTISGVHLKASTGMLGYRDP